MNGLTPHYTAVVVPVINVLTTNCFVLDPHLPFLVATCFFKIVYPAGNIEPH